MCALWFNFIPGLNLFPIVLNSSSYNTIPQNQKKYNLNQEKNWTTTYHEKQTNEMGCFQLKDSPIKT